MTRFERSALLGVPAAILVMSFVVICRHFRTAWPWTVMVHETGTRNLLQTVFYFEHALGELPLDVLLAGAIAGSALLFYFPEEGAPCRRWLAVALGADIFMLAGSWLTVGPSLSIQYLLQYVTRPDAPFEHGSHWRYHLLSQVALMALPIALAGAVAVIHRDRARIHGTAIRILGPSWLLFAILTLAFGVNASSFTDPQYLGHQARELFTHSLVTVPLGLAACLALSNRKKRSGQEARLRWRAALGAGAVYVIPSLYLLVGVLTKSSYSHAQTTDPVRVVCGHFFEHSFSYVVVPSHAAVLYLLGSARA